MLKRAASPCGADDMKTLRQRVNGAVRREELRLSEAKKIETGVAVAALQDLGGLCGATSGPRWLATALPPGTT